MNWWVIRTQVLKHLLGAKKGERGGNKGNVRGRTTARGVMEKSGYVVSGSLRGRRSEKMTKLNTSPQRGSKIPLEFQRGNGN